MIKIKLPTSTRPISTAANTLRTRDERLQCIGVRSIRRIPTFLSTNDPCLWNSDSDNSSFPDCRAPVRSLTRRNHTRSIASCLSCAYISRTFCDNQAFSSSGVEYNVENSLSLSLGEFLWPHMLFRITPLLSHTENRISVIA